MDTVLPIRRGVMINVGDKHRLYQIVKVPGQPLPRYVRYTATLFKKENSLKGYCLSVFEAYSCIILTQIDDVKGWSADLTSSCLRGKIATFQRRYEKPKSPRTFILPKILYPHAQIEGEVGFYSYNTYMDGFYRHEAMAKRFRFI